jgi:DNA repair exonuclease SbcCD nuclease subunit
LKILHTADLHLKTSGDERWAALQAILNIGKKEHIDVLAISGDLFDEKLDTENLRPKIRELFSNNGFDIVLISGNHDCNVCSDMYFGSDVKVLSDLNVPFEKENVRIWGLPFENISNEQLIEKLQWLKSRIIKENTNILLYHGELLDAFFSRKDFGEEGEQRYMPVKLAYFEDLNFNYVLAGHFHSNFDVRMLKNGGYFVYPGSPISITRKETGRRSVNLFETGKDPSQYLMDTPHYEEKTLTLDPFSNEQPIEQITNILEEAHPAAEILLTIEGYFEKGKTGMNETELATAIDKTVGGKCTVNFQAREIHAILEDDVFKSFSKKLNATEFEEETKKQLLEVAIKAMMEASQ